MRRSFKFKHFAYFLCLSVCLIAGSLQCSFFGNVGNGTLNCLTFHSIWQKGCGGDCCFYTLYEPIDTIIYAPYQQIGEEFLHYRQSNAEDINVIYSKAQCSGRWAVQIATEQD